MIGFVKWVIRIMFWLQAFAAPVILCVLIGLMIGSLKLFVPLLFIGGVAGIIVAEYIRRKIGLEIFFTGISGPDEMDKKVNKED
jgi:hypothetical protein